MTPVEATVVDFVVVHIVVNVAVAVLNVVVVDDVNVIVVALFVVTDRIEVNKC